MTRAISMWNIELSELILVLNMSQRCIIASWQIVFLVLCCVTSCQSYFFITRAECKSLDLSFCYFKTCEIKTDEKGNTKMDFNATMRYKKPINDINVSCERLKVKKYNIYIYIINIYHSPKRSAWLCSRYRRRTAFPFSMRQLTSAVSCKKHGRPGSLAL